MSEFSENNEIKEETTEAKQTENVDEQESTIFSAPLEHKDKKRNNGKKRILTVIASLLSIAVLVSGTIAAIKLIPERTDDDDAFDPGSFFDEISVIECSADAVSSVTITNPNGEFKLVPETTVSGDTTTTSWTVEGVDVSKINATSATSIITAVTNVTALKEITGISAENCGFDEPTVTVKVESKDSEKYPAYSIIIGKASPDGIGSYMKTDKDDTIYLVDSSSISSYSETVPIDLASKDAIPATSFKAEDSTYKNDTGIVSFDSLTFSGTAFPQTVTVHKNTDTSDSGSLVTYLVKTPIERYAHNENIAKVLQSFSNSILVNGAYAFDINSKTLAEFELDNPDYIVALTVEGETKSFKIALQDDGYCAVVYDDATMIRKVSTSDIAFIGYTTDDLYMTQPALYSVSDVSNLTFEYAGNSYSFDITYDEDAAESLSVKCGDTKITTSYFQSFYALLADMDCIDFTVNNTTAEAEATIRYTFVDGSVSELKFYAVNAAQYQYSMNDVHMGKIASSVFDKIMKNAKLTADNQKPAI